MSYVYDRRVGRVVWVTTREQYEVIPKDCDAVERMILYEGLQLYTGGIRLATSLERGNIHTERELHSVSDSDLLKLRDIGKVAVHKIREYLKLPGPAMRVGIYKWQSQEPGTEANIEERMSMLERAIQELWKVVEGLEPVGYVRRSFIHDGKEKGEEA